MKLTAKVLWPASDPLLKHVRAVEEGVKLQGKAANRVKGEIRRIVTEDNTEKLLRSVDRYGHPMIPLAPSTLKNKKRGPGPALIPRGLSSRFITNFRATWKGQEPGHSVLVMGWIDIVSKAGWPFAQYHLEGVRKGSKVTPKGARKGARKKPLRGLRRSDWRLPPRDVAGISPMGWSKLRPIWAKFGSDVIRGAV